MNQDSLNTPLFRRCVYIALFLTIYTNLFPPLPFARTQMMFDYSEGFARRGLFGEFLNLFIGDTFSRGEAYLAAFFVTVGGALSLFMYLNSQLWKNLQSIFLLILFVCSFAFGGFFGNSGYLDGVILMLLVLGLVALERGALGYYIALLVMGVSVLIHENALPYISMTLVFAAWMAGPKNGLYGFPRMAFAFGPLIVGLLVTFIVILFGQLDQEQAANLAQTIADRALFPIDPEATDIAGRGLSENIAYFTAKRAEGGYWIWLLFDGGILGVMAIFLTSLNIAIAKENGLVTKALIVLAILAPWSLNLIAFDIMRFGIMSVFSGFIISAILLNNSIGSHEKLQAYLTLPVFLILLVFNLQSGNMQLNTAGSQYTKFPYAMKTHLDWLNLDR